MMFLCLLWKSTPWASLACTSKFESELARGCDSLHLLLSPGQLKYIIPPGEQLNGFCGELETNSYGKIAPLSCDRKCSMLTRSGTSCKTKVDGWQKNK